MSREKLGFITSHGFVTAADMGGSSLNLLWSGTVNVKAAYQGDPVTVFTHTETLTGKRLLVRWSADGKIYRESTFKTNENGSLMIFNSTSTHLSAELVKVSNIQVTIEGNTLKAKSYSLVENFTNKTQTEEEFSINIYEVYEILE